MRDLFIKMEMIYELVLKYNLPEDISDSFFKIGIKKV